MDTTTTNPAASSALAHDGRPEKSLFRPQHDRMLAGVASGVARYLDIDPVIVRIALVVLAFFGGIGIVAYLAGWLLIPGEGRAASIATDFVASVQGNESQP